MSNDIVFTLGFVFGLLVGVLSGGFLMCCFVVAGDHDENS